VRILVIGRSAWSTRNSGAILSGLGWMNGNWGRSPLESMITLFLARNGFTIWLVLEGGPFRVIGGRASARQP
jgi:hypothetical protein